MPGETVEAWELALNRIDGPSCILTTRQTFRFSIGRAWKVLWPKVATCCVMAPMSFSWRPVLKSRLPLETADLLAADGTSARVVSLPCWELFFDQDASYRDAVLGNGIPRVSIEAASDVRLGAGRWRCWPQ